jgi:microcin C transport system substrate-binding protein
MKRNPSLSAVSLLLPFLLAGCGQKGGAPAPMPPAAAATAPSAPGTPAFPGMEADLQNTLRSEPSFYVFKTPADLAKDTQGLKWQDGMDLPEFADPSAKKGGTLRLWLPDFPPTFRTAGPDANGIFRPYLLDEVALAMVEGQPSLPGQFYAELAKDWAEDPVHRTVYFHIDPAARWSDGVPVTTDDMVFTMYMSRSPLIDDPSANNYAKKTYEKITVYDDHTFAVTLKDRKPDLLQQADMSPMPKHFFSDFGPGWIQRYNWRIAPTTGAYVIRDEDVKKQVSVTLTRLDNWWAKDKRFCRGRFNPDKVRLIVIREPEKALAAFIRGDLDISPLNQLEQSSYWYEKLPATQPAVAAGYIVKATFYNQIPCPDFGLWINQARPVLDNQNVRLGIQYAVNFDLICRDYFRGDAEREQTSSDGFGWRTNPTLTARPFDPVKARGYFAQAGFTQQGPDGVLVNGQGQRLSFTVTTYFRRFQDMLIILKQEALKAGLELNIEVLDDTTASKKMTEKQHDIALMAFQIGVSMYPSYWELVDGVNAYDVPYLPDGSPNPARKVKPDTNNLTSIAVPALDKIIDTYDHAESMTQVKALAAQIEQMVYDNAAWVNGWKLPFERYAYWRWIKWPATPMPMQSANYEQAWTFWIDQDAQKETLAAKDAGRTFPKQVLIFDQFKDK